METKEDFYIRASDVRRRLGNISTTTLWRLVKKGVIPQPVRLGGRSALYKNSWIDDLLALEAGTDMAIEG